MGIKNLIKNGFIELWEDIYDAKLDDKAAPDLSDILRREEVIYSNPEEFFKRTYMTKSMEELIEDVAETLKNEKGGAIFLLTSLFGGGKTHTQICLYHAFNNPQKLKEINDKLSAKIAEVGKPIIIVMDASKAGLVPHPDEPYKAENFTIKTIWGMLAYRLGAYAKIKHLDDEKSPAPTTDLIKDILSEAKEPILILMDEIVHYVFNMEKSRLKDYGRKVLLFLDFLARAVESSPKTALIVSIQAEYRVIEGQKQLFEEDVFEGYASKILGVLSRESTRIIVPVSPDDVVKVLQRRIFKKIPENEALKARDKLYAIYRENPEIFGIESDWQFSAIETGRIITAKDTYPFHPKYIEVLQEFVTRNKDLQKTRDAIRITRKVIRKFLKEKGDADFIMPWHINIGDRDIRNRVLTESRKEFRDVVSRDIITEEGIFGSINECSNPLLAFKIATAVFLKTYTYETFKEPLKVFPDLKSVALMVYEPETFAIEGIQPVDIETTLSEMHGRLPHFVSESGRYWFTPFPSVIEYVEKKADEIFRGPALELYKFLTKRTRDILVRKESKKGVVEEGEIFNERNTIVIGYGDDVWRETVISDDPSMKLVVLVKPDVTEEEVRKIILMKGESGKRVFRNTIAVVCPSLDANFETILRYVAKVKAAEEVMSTLSEYYTDKEIKDIQERKLKKYIQENGNLLNQQLLSTLIKIAYPARGKEKVTDEIRWTTTSSSSSLISQVEIGLKDPSTGPKLKTVFSFSDLAIFLKQNQNWDLIEGMERREMKEIINVFYTLTSAPFTTRTAIEQAIRQGLNTLDIGIIIDGNLYWKRIGPENGAEMPPSIKDSAEILPYNIAAEILKEKLIAESGEKKIGKEIHMIWYEVEFAGKRIKLEDLILQKGWTKILKDGIILRQEQVLERGFILKVTPSTLSVKPNEEVKVIVTIDPIEEYPFEVKLNVDKGEINPSKSTLPLKALWNIGILKPGDYKFTIIAEGADGTTSKAILTVTVESPEIEIQVETIDLMHTGAKLLCIIPKDMLSLRMGLSIASKLNLRAEADINLIIGENIQFTGKGMNIKIAELFIQKFNDILRSLPSLEKELKVESIIRFIEPITLDSSKISSLMPLSKNASFKIMVERHE
jgi:predicted AAA+ superfamily ATPase